MDVWANLCLSEAYDEIAGVAQEVIGEPPCNASQ